MTLAKKILKYKLVSSLFAVSFLLALGGTAWVYAALRGAGGPLILHFNDISGITQIGSFDELVWVGVTGILIVILNFFIALELEARDWFWGKLLASGTLLLAILLFIGLAAIISVN